MELQELDTQMTRLGALVENALTQVLSALEMENRDKACAVVVGDTAIDDLHLAIQQHASRTLIYHQPLAGRHLRYLTYLVPITFDYEYLREHCLSGGRRDRHLCHSGPRVNAPVGNTEEGHRQENVGAGADGELVWGACLRPDPTMYEYFL